MIGGQSGVEESGKREVKGPKADVNNQAESGNAEKQAIAAAQRDEAEVAAPKGDSSKWEEAEKEENSSPQIPNIKDEVKS